MKLILHFFLGENIAEAWNILEKEGLPYCMFSDRCKQEDCQNIQYKMDSFLAWFQVPVAIMKYYQCLSWQQYPSGYFLKEHHHEFKTFEGFQCPKCNQWQEWRFLAQDHIDECLGQ